MSQTQLMPHTAIRVPETAPGALLPALSLCQRELVRFIRQRHRIVGALATPLSFTTFFLSLGAMLIISFALTALGLAIAWRMTSTQGFHAIMNLFLMPMWFLSGALFPERGAWGGLQWVMAFNPLRYGLVMLRRALYWHEAAVPATLPSMSMSLGISVAFAATMFEIASV